MSDTLQIIFELIRTQGISVVLLVAILLFIARVIWPFVTREITEWRNQFRDDTLRRDDRDEKFRERNDQTLDKFSTALVQHSLTIQSVSESTRKITETLEKVSDSLSQSKNHEEATRVSIGRLEEKVGIIDRKVDDLSEAITNKNG